MCAGIIDSHTGWLPKILLILECINIPGVVEPWSQKHLKLRRWQRQLLTDRPEIDINFITKDDIIIMNSGNWTLKGNSGLIIKDSKFMQTFDIDIKGSLAIDNDKTIKDINKQIVTIGWVEYNVKGLKPKVFRNAPSFLLDKTISFIKTCVTTFVSIQFEPKLLESFRKFTYERLKSL